ncbi:MAG: zinc ribbon domain-containing protein [Syntrophothermus sp.]
MEIPRHWRLKAQRFRLKGRRCPTCDQAIFPPRPVCPHCAIPLARIAERDIRVLPINTNLTYIKSHIWYLATERMTG